MQQAILHHFPDVQATYRFTHRSSEDVKFSRECFERFKASIPRAYLILDHINLYRGDQSLDFVSLALTPEERACLEKHCPYFKPTYLDRLASYRFKPDQVKVHFIPVSPDEPNWGDIEMEASGPWHETIFWEVPLMACLSEQYFRTVDTDWNYDGQAGACVPLLAV